MNETERERERERERSIRVSTSRSGAVRSDDDALSSLLLAVTATSRVYICSTACHSAFIEWFDRSRSWPVMTRRPSLLSAAKITKALRFAIERLTPNVFSTVIPLFCSSSALLFLLYIHLSFVCFTFFFSFSPSFFLSIQIAFFASFASVKHQKSEPDERLITNQKSNLKISKGVR